MYTIGEVEKITGISKDRLRYYEEKGILKPDKSEQNGYRKFSVRDVIEVLSVEYFRSMDLGMKAIKEIREQGDVETLNHALDRKSEEIAKKITALQNIHKRIQRSKEECERVVKHLNQFCVRKMPALKIIGELSDSTAFSEYTIVQKQKLEGQPIIKSMMREITFLDGSIESNKMLIVEEIDETKEYEIVDSEDMLREGDCLYIVVEEQVDGEDIMKCILEKGMVWIRENGYEFKNTVFVKVLFLIYPSGQATSYLEIYAPILKR